MHLFQYKQLTLYSNLLMFHHAYFMTTCFTLPCLSTSPCYSVFKARQRREITEVATGTKVIQ